MRSWSYCEGEVQETKLPWEKLLKHRWYVCGFLNECLAEDGKALGPGLLVIFKNKVEEKHAWIKLSAVHGQYAGSVRGHGRECI